jgi:GH24 family phage-related lysozyme (muramidase)
MPRGRGYNPAADRRLARNGGVLVLASAALLAFLGNWENGPGKTDTVQARTVYADKLAKGLPTACGGITEFTTSEPVIVGDVWSVERCNRVMREVVTKTQYGILDCISAPMTQNTFDAMSSMAHNVGITGACGSRAAGLIDAGRLEEGCRAISLTPEGKPNWSIASGKFVPGLFNRRQAETVLCLKP